MAAEIMKLREMIEDAPRNVWVECAHCRGQGRIGAALELRCFPCFGKGWARARLGAAKETGYLDVLRGPRNVAVWTEYRGEYLVPAEDGTPIDCQAGWWSCLQVLEADLPELCAVFASGPFSEESEARVAAQETLQGLINLVHSVMGNGPS